MNIPEVTRYTHHTPNADGLASALAYDALVHRPDSLTESYDNLKAVLLEQYDLLVAAGMVFDFAEGDLYADSAEMRADVARGHLTARLTVGVDYDDLPDAAHPMRAESPRGVLWNDVFRAVHDVYGHAYSGSGFSPKGEYTAWLAHRETMPEVALPALWCETRGQNTWTNNLPGHDAYPLSERPFASQKVGKVDTSLI